MLTEAHGARRGEHPSLGDQPQNWRATSPRTGRAHQRASVRRDNLRRFQREPPLRTQRRVFFNCVGVLAFVVDNKASVLAGVSLSTLLVLRPSLPRPPKRRVCRGVGARRFRDLFRSRQRWGGGEFLTGFGFGSVTSDAVFFLVSLPTLCRVTVTHDLIAPSLATSWQTMTSRRGPAVSLTCLCLDSQKKVPATTASTARAVPALSVALT